MGASSKFYSVSYDLTQEEITKEWNRAVDNDLHYNGHDPYSGGIGTMGHGILFYDNKFDDAKIAEKWVLDHHEKWSKAFAVSYFNKNRVLKWLIGGWCAE